MKIKRIIATGAVLALIGGSSALTAAAAMPTLTPTPTPTTNYVKAADFGTEASPYARNWFKGNATPATTVSDSASGLVVTGQILNGNTPTSGLVGLVTDADLRVESGNAYFQVPVFAAGTDGFTTLRPEVAGQPSVSGTWITSQAIAAADAPNGNGTAYDAGDSATLTAFAAALGEDVSILAYGAFVNPGTSATISSMTWNGVTSVFTPESTATASATSVTLSEFTTGAGVTVTITGFIPGESVQPGYGTGESGNSYGDPIVADENGAVTVKFVLPNATLGTYTLTANSDARSGARVEVTVVADGTAIAAPATPISGKASFAG
ncbi:hypothetical protein [Frigoribacterium sp. CG_9.8]|uniref:hypothetical protein n=1 Tax=Frigoribacterium sp. CG_9.8 TaxID=2787733 RepID=UPI0018C930DD|nr:hypothetical protein [Frigoribacterium sp. CG_9.8]MBG6106521.1 hypothetical protein [Frigoribacterium sp. CG_9.8]